MLTAVCACSPASAGAGAACHARACVRAWRAPCAQLYDIVDAWRAGQWKGSGPADASAPLDAAASAGSASATKRLSPGQWLQDLALRGHCSALVKVAGDLSDIYVGHATWDSYTQVRRAGPCGSAAACRARVWRTCCTCCSPQLATIVHTSR